MINSNSSNGLFSSTKQSYLGVFLNDLTVLQEFLILLQKFTQNFNIRHLNTTNNQNLVVEFINRMYEFTIGILTDQTLSLDHKRVVMRELTLKINVIWTKIHLDSFQLKLPYLTKLEQFLTHIVTL